MAGSVISTKGGLAGVAKQQAATVKAASTLGVLVETADVRERFQKMLGKKSEAFLSSLLTLSNQNAMLKKCAPTSVLSAAAIAASLDLPINPSLGMAWIIPYGSTAQFQLGYKGLIQLAQRSGQMKSIIVTEVYEGEIRNFCRFTETYEPGEKISDKIVGYFASFELINGFKKSVYWTRDEVIAHAKKFSKAYNSGPWKSDEPAMCKKTVLSALLRTFAPMSTQMQDGISAEVTEQPEIGADEVRVETVETTFEEVTPCAPEDAAFTQEEKDHIDAILKEDSK